MAKDLGKVCMVQKGTWSETETYEKLDLVTYEGSSYVALVDSVPTGECPTDAEGKVSSYWLEVASGAYRCAVKGGMKPEDIDETTFNRNCTYVEYAQDLVTVRDSAVAAAKSATSAASDCNATTIQARNALAAATTAEGLTGEGLALGVDETSTSVIIEGKSMVTPALQAVDALAVETSEKTDLMYDGGYVDVESLYDTLTFEGADDEKVEQWLSVKSSTKYCIKADPKIWNFAETTSETVTAVGVYEHSSKSGTSINTLKTILVKDFTSFDDLTFTTNSNTKYIRILFRAVSGTSVDFKTYFVNPKYVEALQTQIDNIETNINDSVYTSEALSANYGNYYLMSDGSLSDKTSQYNVSGFIKVEEGNKIVYQGYTGSLGVCVCGYTGTDASTFVKVLLDYGDYTENAKSIVIGSDVNYIRYCGRIDIFSLIAKKLVLLKEKVDDFSKTWLYGKTVAIVGDSISTNGNSGSDCNVPEIEIGSEDVGAELSAYVTYNDVQAGLVIGGHTCVANDIGTELTFTPTSDDVGKKIGLPADYNKTSKSIMPWWLTLKDKLGITPIPVCWSGASISSHDLTSDTYKTKKNFYCAHAWHPSQIRKMGVRTAGSMERTAPDVVIIFRGTNDYSHDYNVEITDGIFDNGTFSVPETDLLSNGNYGYIEGYCMTIKAIREAYPEAKIILCTLTAFRRGVSKTAFPCNNGINTIPQYNEAVRKVADYFGCGVIGFDKDGITFENCLSYIYDNTASEPTHPNNSGHAVMAEKAIADLKVMYTE